ncbi:hypothetical protein [Haloarcula salinisoli]|uniref:Uncharacterized protein n=1 Tax=Haloarcula salinisoli TaxID=2487746 RepID=A0A8J7YCB7_9EURY|nr:hypothetical protein [Halomicroarcula salinisoli]MBX0285073.1 hypothetical protein [Halomicroarcula salinisoli]MBX0303450.1 hypothetical protein [Halomicroarcula salinisoli]
MRPTVADFRPDIPYRLRHLIGPRLTRLARRVGRPEFRLHRSGYAGTVDVPMNEFERALSTGGFAWGPVSWYHQPPVGADPNGSWTYRRVPFSDRQLHVILSRRDDDRIDVYAHWEYNWRRHPVKHAKQLGIDREGGSTSMQAWFDSQGIDYDSRSRTRRKVSHAVRRVAASLLGRGTGE